MTDNSKYNAHISDFSLLCKQHGIRATHQRVEILRVLATTKVHPSAEMVYNLVKNSLPTISLDTVYRTLRLLEDKKIISQVGLLQECDRFDGNTSRHQHFVCSKCGLIRDFCSDIFSQLPTPPEATELGSVDNVYIELRGICRKCKNKIISGNDT